MDRPVDKSTEFGGVHLVDPLNQKGPVDLNHSAAKGWLLHLRPPHGGDPSRSGLFCGGYPFGGTLLRPFSPFGGTLFQFKYACFPS